MCEEVEINKAMNTLPKDPNMLYSYINLKLRDEYNSLDELCSSLDITSEEVINALNSAGYQYDEELNQFR